MGESIDPSTSDASLPRADASADESFPHFAGHLGHLSTAQQEALETFKANLVRAGLYTAQSSGDKHENGEASHDDPTLLRFLRARGFNTAAAQKQFGEAEAWRKKHDVDRLYAGFEAEEFEQAKRFYPRWTGRRDKQGLPLYVFQLSALVPIQRELDLVSPERRHQRMVALYELMTRFSFPLCSYLPHPSPTTPISSTTSIIDLGHVSLSSLWSLRGHLQEASRLATANYPETLGRVVIVNSPAFFPTVWGWIKNWFDEGTRDKIYVLGKDPGPRLRELVDVQDLPKVYGGEMGWTYVDEPSLDEDARKVLGHGEEGKGMPRGPAAFGDGMVRRPEVKRNTDG